MEWSDYDLSDWAEFLFCLSAAATVVDEPRFGVTAAEETGFGGVADDVATD